LGIEDWFHHIREKTGFSSDGFFVLFRRDRREPKIVAMRNAGASCGKYDDHQLVIALIGNIFILFSWA